ncbi:MAG TPA: hypothetical protein VKQ72_15930 [Aggregatilineales bacterium]|nr:hypothetical protein [Aggregatilineales bacterium]
MTVRVLKRYFSVITDTLRLRPPAFKSYRHQKQDEDRHRRHHLKRKARLESKLDKGTPYHLGADGEIVFDRNERGELEEDRGR